MRKAITLITIGTAFLAMGLVAPAPAHADDTGRILSRTSAKAASVESRAERLGDRHAIDLSARARDLLTRARAASRDGRRGKARDLALQAQRLLTRAEDSLGNARRRTSDRARGDKGAARSAIAELDRRLSAASNAIARNPAAGAKATRLLNTARANRDKAASALARGDAQSAERLAKAGKRAALQAQERAARGGGGKVRRPQRPRRPRRR